jgi:hypothetical protein
MRCFNKLLDDFVAAARSGRTPEVRTETQRIVMSVLAKRAVEQGIELNVFNSESETTRCESRGVLVSS